MTSSKNTRNSRADVTASEATVIAKTNTTAPGKVALAKSVPKTSAKTLSKPAAEPNSTAIPNAAKPKSKSKLVRDSFTIPKSEYAVLEGLKVRAANLTRPVKKSELLRAGVAALNAMTDKAFLAALNGVQSLKTGRPKAHGATSTLDKGAK
jgi:hypothetical protein